MRRDGSRFWASGVATPVRDRAGELIGFSKVMRDMTELRQMHEVLQLRAEELEHANRIKDEFLATMSHELRTPLTSIMGWSRLLGSNRLNEREKERAVSVIQRNAEAQSKLIEDLLDVSRIITGKLRIEVQPVSFASITESVINSLRPAIDAKQLHLEKMIDPAAGPILGDPSRLQQIVTNLLSNAIKFTPGGGRIEVSLQRRDSHVRLEIRDAGVGIAAENLPYIFERFRQVDSSNMRAHGGLGLGLAIVDYLVRQQAGFVSAESEGLGKGAAFSVEFPVTSSEIIRSEPEVELFTDVAKALIDDAESSVKAKLKGRKVLLVEEEVDTQELLRTVLKRHGAEVIAVNSSASALAEISRSRPDVIINDIGMAGEDGYELIRSIRSLDPEAGGHIPAIALTAYAGAADRRRALLAGFQTHLGKPVDPDDLLAVILSLTFQREMSSEQTQNC
jgi:signal transduction histidine kinase/CheY-like chemotaxis protein